jgi:hypothetical protein
MDERARELFGGAPAPIAESCVSDLTLDRRVLGELESEEASSVEAHLESCTRCRARAAALSVHPALDPAVRRIVLGRRTRWLRIGAPLALAASLAIAFLIPGSDTRRKGGLSLTVYRERHGEVVRSGSGEIFHPGDRLRFEVDAPRGYLLIMGIDAGGERYACVPLDGRARPVQDDLKKVLLPDAVKLDESLGRERLVLVHCPAPFALGALDVRDHRVITPPDCDTSELVFEKTR